MSGSISFSAFLWIWTLKSNRTLEWTKLKSICILVLGGSYFCCTMELHKVWFLELYLLKHTYWLFLLLGCAAQPILQYTRVAEFLRPVINQWLVSVYKCYQREMGLYLLGQLQTISPEYALQVQHGNRKANLTSASGTVNAWKCKSKWFCETQQDTSGPMSSGVVQSSMFPLSHPRLW